jgi:DnaJ-class molecular chaperone
MNERGGKDRDLYEALGVSRGDDAKAIRKAYRKLARQYHPDVNPGDAAAEERFKEISRAYAILSDPEKRRNYDEFGQISLDSGFDAEAARRAKASFGTRFGGAEDFGGGFAEEFSFGDLDDMFGRIFTRRGEAASRPSRPRRGPDLETEIELDFLEAARGGEHRISLARPAADGSLKQERLAIRIPPGVADGGRIRLAGKGGESRSGGPAGDLHLNVRVRPHPVLRREGRDLHVEVPIGVSEAVLGARIEVPTLEGRATVTVPEGTDSGRKLRLRGKGIPHPKGGPPGDLFVTVQIRVPRGLDAEARAKFEELAKLDPTDLRKGMDP